MNGQAPAVGEDGTEDVPMPLAQPKPMTTMVTQPPTLPASTTSAPPTAQAPEALALAPEKKQKKRITPVFVSANN